MSILHNTEIKKGKGRLIYNIIVVILIIGIPLQVFPYFWMITNAFKSDQEILKLPPTWYPHILNFNGIADTFIKFKLGTNLLNTLILCGIIIILQITISALAAFSISKMRPKYGNLVLLLFVGTLMISPTAMMFPLYIMMANLPFLHISLINNMWSYILPECAWGYTLFLFKGFFDGLPNELFEAARIDGASSFRIFSQIVVPLSKPVIAVNILQTFIAVYNDFMLPLILLPDQKKWTIMVRIFNAQDSSTTAGWNNIMVMTVVATLPVLIVYLIAQKHVVQGITMTGLKG